jgi:hypothetical protein
MTDFQERLRKAIERGERRGKQHAREAEAKALSEEEYRRLHSNYRLQLSEHIETCVKQLPQHFPGFQFETIYGERGWGAGCRRDDFGRTRDGQRTNYLSRLEITVRPHSPLNILDLAAKGTIRNKEVFNRNHFEKLGDVDPEDFENLIDLWVPEYAELFAASA